MGEGLGMGNEPASFKTFKEGIGELFSPTGPSPEQIDARAVEMMGKNSKLPFDTAVKRATSELSPGLLRTYGPAAVAGIGAMSAFGGFDPKPVQGGPITQSLMKPVTQRIAEEGTQRQVYMQGLPGVQYDQYGAPVFGGANRLPTYDVPDYNSAGLGSLNMDQMYNPYLSTNPYMAPRQYAHGGDVQYFDEGGAVTGFPARVAEAITANTTTPNSKLPANFNWEQYVATHPDLGRAGIDTQAEAESHWLTNGLRENRALNQAEAEARQTAAATTAAQQKANRDRVAQEKAMKRAAGFGTSYANINAGLSALAPENDPRGTYAPSPKSKFTDKQVADYLTNNPNLTDATFRPIMDQYGVSVNQVASATGRPVSEIQQRYDAVAPVKGGPAAPPSLSFGEENRRRQIEQRRQDYAPILRGQQSFFAQQAAKYAKPPAPEGIAALAQGGYPRRTGQISGPGTEKSDSIPAMLSDGEFVMTAKAVRGAGKGSRRAGAKQMYKLMHQLEKNSERG
jgi:hypothetical protein